MELVTTKQDQTVTSSRIVAEYFEKQHKDVLKGIRKLLDDEPSLKNCFYLDSYTDNYNKERTMYYMNEMGFSLLVMGFNGKKALKWKIDFYNAFCELKVKRSFTLNSKLKELQQINSFLVAENNKKLLTAYKGDLYTVTSIAKEYGLNARKLNQLLKDLNIQHKNEGRWVVNAMYEDMVEYIGYDYHSEAGDSSGYNFTMKWNNKGKQFIDTLLQATEMEV